MTNKWSNTRCFFSLKVHACLAFLSLFSYFLSQHMESRTSSSMYGETFEASEILPGFLFLGSDESAICSLELLRVMQLNHPKKQHCEWNISSLISYATFIETQMLLKKYLKNFFSFYYLFLGTWHHSHPDCWFWTGCTPRDFKGATKIIRANLFILTPGLCFKAICI